MFRPPREESLHAGRGLPKTLDRVWMDRRTALSAHALSTLGIDTSQSDLSRPVLKRKFGAVANRKEQRKAERMAAKQHKHALYQKKHTKPAAPAPAVALPAPSLSVATKPAKVSSLTRQTAASAASAESAKPKPPRRDLPDGGAAARFHSMFDGVPVSEADADRKMVWWVPPARLMIATALLFLLLVGCCTTCSSA
jgi:hypothetical protein